MKLGRKAFIRDITTVLPIINRVMKVIGITSIGARCSGRFMGVSRVSEQMLANKIRHLVKQHGYSCKLNVLDQAALEHADKTAIP